MKSFITVVVSLIIGFAVGVAATVFFYPFIFPPAEVNEQVSNLNQKIMAAKGVFYNQHMKDPVHWGQGDVTIYRSHNDQYEVFLNKNFEVGPGPAFHVYVSESAGIRGNKQFKAAKNVDLGILKSFRGSQIYKIPTSMNFAKVKSVVIWCKSFGQYITSADLNSAR